MPTIRFIRHGESLANAGKVTGEPHSIPLTPLGREQAAAVAESFEAAPDLIICSDYLRARDTAAATMARFPHVPMEIWPVQEFACIATPRRIGTTTAQRHPWTEAFWALADPDHADGEGAESYAAFAERACAALERLKALQCGSVALFAHGQFINMLRWEIERGSPLVTAETMAAFRRFHLGGQILNAGGFTARWDGSVWHSGDVIALQEALLSG
jgi:broad specificity phosphatase PhoE